MPPESRPENVDRTGNVFSLYQTETLGQRFAGTLRLLVSRLSVAASKDRRTLLFGSLLPLAIAIFAYTIRGPHGYALLILGYPALLVALPMAGLALVSYGYRRAPLRVLLGWVLLALALLPAFIVAVVICVLVSSH